ncbi:hypothetical protein AB1L42_11005 [Thalassoglobus sp. JC818]|uniref:hypothetical protein n=1 Tax=Thalassoglobus sp. JC818 TaxID=3232136 RepID=UPI00345A06F3
MRGPSVRIRYDVRRLWKCPECGYERKVDARHTSVRCHCQDGNFFMRLVEPKRFVRPELSESDCYVTEDDFPEEPGSGPSIENSQTAAAASTESQPSEAVTADASEQSEEATASESPRNEVSQDSVEVTEADSEPQVEAGAVEPSAIEDKEESTHPKPASESTVAKEQAPGERSKRRSRKPSSSDSKSRDGNAQPNAKSRSRRRKKRRKSDGASGEAGANKSPQGKQASKENPSKPPGDSTKNSSESD